MERIDEYERQSASMMTVRIDDDGRNCNKRLQFSVKKLQNGNKMVTFCRKSYKKMTKIAKKLQKSNKKRQKVTKK